MKAAFGISSICATDYHGTMAVLPRMGLILSPCALNLVLSVRQEVPWCNTLIPCSWFTLKIYVTNLLQASGGTQRCAWPGFQRGKCGKNRGPRRQKHVLKAQHQSHLINPCVKIENHRWEGKWLNNAREGVKHTSGPLYIMHQIKRTGKRLLQKHNMTCPSEWICEC